MKQKIMEFMNGMMAGFIKENDFKIKCMDQVKLPDQMGNFMKDIIVYLAYLTAWNLNTYNTQNIEQHLLDLTEKK